MRPEDKLRHRLKGGSFQWDEVWVMPELRLPTETISPIAGFRCQRLVRQPRFTGRPPHNTRR